MGWELSFDIEKVDLAEFCEWLEESYPEARFSKDRRSVCVDYIDGIEDSFEGDVFFGFIDAVEERFPNARYEASYEETSRVTDSRLVDVRVTYDGKRSVTDNIEQDGDDLGSLLKASGFAYLVDEDDFWNDEQCEPIAHVDNGFDDFVNVLVWSYVDDAAAKGLKKCDTGTRFLGFLMSAHWIGGGGDDPEWCRNIGLKHLDSALKAAELLGYDEYQSVIRAMIAGEQEPPVSRFEENDLNGGDSVIEDDDPDNSIRENNAQVLADLAAVDSECYLAVLSWFDDFELDDPQDVVDLLSEDGCELDEPDAARDLLRRYAKAMQIDIAVQEAWFIQADFRRKADEKDPSLLSDLAVFLGYEDADSLEEQIDSSSYLIDRVLEADESALRAELYGRLQKII